jgi:hypothetical protein
MGNNKLQELLDIELERLKLAVAFEKEKKIVFPETTQIVRDILKIEDRIKLSKVSKVKNTPKNIL